MRERFSENNWKLRGLSIVQINLTNVIIEGAVKSWTSLFPCILFSLWFQHTKPTPACEDEAERLNEEFAEKKLKETKNKDINIKISIV